jgi:hypothetical protein
MIIIYSIEEVYNMSDLEKDFTDIANKINEQIKLAAKALNEANRLATENGIKTLNMPPEAELSDYNINDDEEDTYEDFLNLVDWNPIISEMDAAGWQTSSFYC